jgi:hypothetical protein
MNRLRLVVIVLGALGVVLFFRTFVHVHFGYIAEDERETRSGIEQFHNRLTAGEFDRIYADLDLALTSRVSPEALIPQMRDTRDRWGKVERVTYSYLKGLHGKRAR